jgi:uncharacterized protein (UPF0276 family)
VKDINGFGLGLRRDFLQDINRDGFLPDFWEVTPENWLCMPYHHREKFEEVMTLRPTVAHGLSLSIGSPEPLDMKFLKSIKKFLDTYHIEHYSEHISFSSHFGDQTYELLPLSMTKKNLLHVKERIQRVQDFLQRELILENATYYYTLESEMSEAEFINSLLESSGAKLLLDVNNVYVNATNHKFSAKQFLKELDISKTAYIHMAGHYEDKELEMLIDSHGMPIRDEVWELLKTVVGVIDVPVMIERDNNIPPLSELIEEYRYLQSVVKEVQNEKC